MCAHVYERERDRHTQTDRQTSIDTEQTHSDWQRVCAQFEKKGAPVFVHTKVWRQDGGPPALHARSTRKINFQKRLLEIAYDVLNVK